MFNSIQWSLKCPLWGIGEQSLISIVSGTSYSIIGISISTLAAFYFELGLAGVWLGYTTGTIIIAIVFAYFSFKIDWIKEQQRWTLRINKA